MVEQLFSIGMAQGLGIFFFLFVAAAILFWRFTCRVMDDNNKREQRYIDTIDTLATSLGEMGEVKTCINEARKDIEETKGLIGKVLDRLPVK